MLLTGVGAGVGVSDMGGVVSPRAAESGNGATVPVAGAAGAGADGGCTVGGVGSAGAAGVGAAGVAGAGVGVALP